MVTKGLVESVTGNLAKVRLPVYDRITSASQFVSDDLLHDAQICTVGGCRPNLKKGDVVIVSFEDDDKTTPIILGVLFVDSVSSSKMDLSLLSLNVEANTQLSADTTIGDAQPQDFANLAGTKGNLQQQIDLIMSRIDSLTGLG